jgi:hypothetical protein
MFEFARCEDSHRDVTRQPTPLFLPLKTVCPLFGKSPAISLNLWRSVLSLSLFDLETLLVYHTLSHLCISVMRATAFRRPFKSLPASEAVGVGTEMVRGWRGVWGARGCVNFCP